MNPDILGDRRARRGLGALSASSTGKAVALLMIGAVSTTGLVALTADVASAAPPAFPDNIVVFPDRDFITIEGYQDHLGETATVEVTRAGVGIVGSAQAVVEEGDVAFEVNHPGGYCWGAGTGLKVTPDIRGGDVVTIKFGGKAAGDTTVAEAAVTEVQHASGSSIVKVIGRLGAGDNPLQLEQRVVNPDLRDTIINRRDVRAVPGPLVAAPRGGYSSSLETSGSTFTATYDYQDAAIAAKVAAGGGERLMSWQVEDADANRQGLTIAEFGELGGPGMGGCPNGPLASGPVGPTNVVAATVAGGYKVSWTPAVATPGTPAITGYHVNAVSQTSTNGERAVIGKRIDGQAAKATTLTGLAAGQDYDLEIVSESSSGLTYPAVNVRPEVDSIAPVITASPAGGTYKVAQSVTLKSNEPNTDIYYTTDSTLDNLFDGDAVSAQAVHYTGPVAIPTTSDLRWVAFDTAGNLTSGSASYIITETPDPVAPVLAEPVLSANSVTVNWTSNDLSITGFSVQAFNAAKAPVEDAQLLARTATTATVTGLQPDAQYTVRVTAINDNGQSEPVETKVFTAIGAVTANAGADQTAKRNTLVVLDGRASSLSASGTVKWEQVLSSPTDPNKVTLADSTTLKPSFTLPLFKYPMTNGALTFKLTVTDETVIKTDEVTVTAIADAVTAVGPKWKAGDFRVSGTATTIGATVTVRSANNPALVLGTAPVTAAAAPATGGTWTLRVRTGSAATTNPGRIFADSSMGGTAGPVVVALG